MTRFTLTAATAIILGLAAPAVAGNQLATSLGVEPGVYTVAELTDLRRAYEESDMTRINFILSGSETGHDNAGASAQFAASSDVDGTDFTFGELVELERAIEESDEVTAQFIRDNAGARGVTASSRSETQSKAQLAAGLGVDASDFSVADLASLRIAMEESDYPRINMILNRPAL